jgi:hypothetical protein
MENKGTKFNSLTPDILEENKPVYTDALDYAFSNDDIRNIAITGVYGAGKSTVWNTYKNNKSKKSIRERISDLYSRTGIKKEFFKQLLGAFSNPFENVITVCLGKYIDNLGEDSKSNLDSRVESQIINQILSQIKEDNIPLSKYKFKVNISGVKLFWNIFLTILFAASICFWGFRKEIVEIVKTKIEWFDMSVLLLSSSGMFFLSIGMFLYQFYKKNTVKFSKVSFKGAEAKLSDDNNDETVLERDMKEIVYLLSSSGSGIVVFEDLDRYDSVDIFIKLKELNFLLNSYLETNGIKRTVRFVYLIKDGLFYSKDRTKFFDFILPIVPIVDSKTSENQLISLLEDVENAPDRRLLIDISLYIDDMRILRNIVNEYLIYSKNLPLQEFKLDKNKLFALLTIKNLHPNEFDLLQEDKGYIISVFKTLENNRTVVDDNIKTNIDNINEKIEFLSNRIEKSRYDAMSLLVPADVRIDSRIPWTDFLKKWSENSNSKYYIYGQTDSGNYDYNEFVDKFILTDSEKKNFITRFSEDEDKISQLDKLNSVKLRLEQDAEQTKFLKFKDLISMMKPQQINELFKNNDESSRFQDFPLIRYLIVEGILDETYWYYKGNFEIDKSNTLKQNDIIYLKGLLEQSTLNIFLNIESPDEIINRLKLSDYSKFNILNSTLLKTLIQNHNSTLVERITNTINRNDNYKDLIQILDKYDFELTQKYLDILLEYENNQNKIVKILEECKDGNSTTIQNVLLFVLTSELLSNLELYKFYIENNVGIISLIPDDKMEMTLDKIKIAEIKFKRLFDSNIDSQKLIEIEKIKAYETSISNLVYITQRILKKSVPYGILLNAIFESPQLSSMTEYILANFDTVVSDYINQKDDTDKFVNGEDILVKIINSSNLSVEKKCKYLENNSTIISEVNSLAKDSMNDRIFGVLFDRNLILCTTNNINAYWDMIETYHKSFVQYLNRMINTKNAAEIFGSNIPLCDVMIEDLSTNEIVFEAAANYAKDGIAKIDSNFKQDRIRILIKKDLLKPTEENVKVLLEKSYNEELILLANSYEKEVVDLLSAEELSEELIYNLINSNLSTSGCLTLIEKLNDGILLEKVKPNKNDFIEVILDQSISPENIAYICNNFQSFTLKEEFIKQLDYDGDLETLDNKYLSDSFMEYVLKQEYIDTETKTSLIERKIINNTEPGQLKKYISLVDEISELSTVWENKQPALDNEYKEKVGNALVKNKHVKIRNSKDFPRLMLYR